MEGVARLRIVYPDGEAEEIAPTERPVDRGDMLWTPRGDFEVAYVAKSAASEETITYLAVLTAEAIKAKKIFFDIDSGTFPLLLPEVAELADRLRRQSGGDTGSPKTALAVRIEQHLEKAARESLRMRLTDEQMSTLRWAIEEWLTEVGATAVPERVVDLRFGLHRRSRGPQLR